MRFIKRICASFRGADDRYFRTPNLHLAAILFAQDFALVNVDRSDPSNCQFVFRTNNNLESTAQRFDSKLPIFVEARKLIYAWRQLREKMNEDRF